MSSDSRPPLPRSVKDPGSLQSLRAEALRHVLAEEQAALRSDQVDPLPRRTSIRRLFLFAIGGFISAITGIFGNKVSLAQSAPVYGGPPPTPQPHPPTQPPTTPPKPTPSPKPSTKPTPKTKPHPSPHGDHPAPQPEPRKPNAAVYGGPVPRPKPQPNSTPKPDPPPKPAPAPKPDASPQ
jgi:hypothetical protein